MDECQCACIVISAMFTAQPPLLRYEEVLEVEQLRDVGEWLRCVCCSVLWCFESVCVVSISPALYVSMVWMLEELANEE
jgi:hypothetical protein